MSMANGLSIGGILLIVAGIVLGMHHIAWAEPVLALLGSACIIGALCALSA